jgi:hypothetical protein
MKAPELDDVQSLRLQVDVDGLVHLVTPPGSKRPVAGARSSTIRLRFPGVTGFSKATRLATTDTSWLVSI